MEIFLLLVGVVSCLWVRASLKRKVRSLYRPKYRSAHSKPRRTVRSVEARQVKPKGLHKELQGPAFVLDGDSLRIQGVEVRLFGVDAPEMNHPYGKQAKWALVSLCKGKSIRAEVDHIDDHGRSVARCFLPDGKDLSAEMVKLGLAIDWPKFSGGVYQSLETPGVRRKLWLADARQKGRMHVWKQFETKQAAKAAAGR